MTAPAASHNASFLDCTFGGGGHSRALLQANSSSTVTGFDRDQRAVDRGLESFESFGSRISVGHASFAELAVRCAGKKFAGMLADLGLSSDQLDEQRGFSFSDQSPLDMRMDESQEGDAAALVNTLGERELHRMLREGGVGQEAGVVARTIVKNRPIVTAKQLSDLIGSVLVKKRSEKSTNPATVVFQALRIAVNQEFDQIRALLDAAPTLVASGGRLAVIAFHSLEDKIVARTMRGWQEGGEFSASWPGLTDTSASLGRLVGKGVVYPSEDEIARNPRARSARLRVFEFN